MTIEEENLLSGEAEANDTTEQNAEELDTVEDAPVIDPDEVDDEKADDPSGELDNGDNEDDDEEDELDTDLDNDEIDDDLKFQAYEMGLTPAEIKVFKSATQLELFLDKLEASGQNGQKDQPVIDVPKIERIEWDEEECSDEQNAIFKKVNSQLDKANEEMKMLVEEREELIKMHEANEARRLMEQLDGFFEHTEPTLKKFFGEGGTMELKGTKAGKARAAVATKMDALYRGYSAQGEQVSEKELFNQAINLLYPGIQARKKVDSKKTKIKKSVQSTAVKGQKKPKAKVTSKTPDQAHDDAESNVASWMKNFGIEL